MPRSRSGSPCQDAQYAVLLAWLSSRLTHPFEWQGHHLEYGRACATSQADLSHAPIGRLLDQLASASMKIQKFGKLALGETTDRIDFHATTNEGQIFQEAMELIDQVVRERQSDDNQGLH